MRRTGAVVLVSTINDRAGAGAVRIVRAAGLEEHREGAAALRRTACVVRDSTIAAAQWKDGEMVIDDGASCAEKLRW